MSIVLVQLSDIHFQSPQTEVGKRAIRVARAVIAKAPTAEGYFLVLSGDIANTGDRKEYEIAEHFLEELKNELKSAGAESVHIIAVPGNHDLNLREEPDTRQLILESLEKYLVKPIDFNGFNFEALISPQGNFFAFEASVTGTPQKTGSEKLHYQRVFQIGSRSIMFHCFNTAWLSRRHEIQSKLYIPLEALSGTTPAQTDLSVALFHHPYNWLDATNQRLLKQFVESQADVVLTGHEHDPGAERRLNIRGSGLDYLQAPAFDDPEVSENGFQILVVDFQNEDQEILQFKWDGVLFKEGPAATWRLNRNSQRPINPFDLRPEFRAQLLDMGTAFRHPRCVPPQCKLRLRDLYVYPDLTLQRPEEAGTKTRGVESIKSPEIPQLLEKHPDIAIYGPDDCGKTALARVLYEDLMSKGSLPLLIQGDDLKGAAKEHLLSHAINTAIVEQYAAPDPGAYLQEAKAKKIAIIDGLEKARLSRPALAQVVAHLRLRFHKIVIFASDLFQIQDMATATEGNPLKGFERCRIKEFGRFHRHKLIRAWLSFGREDMEEIDGIEKEVSRIDQTISTLMGKNVLPHFPVTILTILQMMESKETNNTANGAYGYMYEVLLKSALAKVNPRDVDEKITYISGIGYRMFKAAHPVLTEEEIREVHAEYCSRYDMVRDFSKMMSDLKSAEVLVEQRGNYRFKYPYEYYYSVAKYFQDHAASASIRLELRTAVDYISGEANANVLIFYVYLTKDDELIRHIIASAQQMFNTFAPCDMESAVEFINQMTKTTPPPLVLECGNQSENRDEQNRRQDEAEEQELQVPVGETDVKYSEALHPLAKITLSFKTLQILGQVIRNFTGSLEGPLKLEITRECYSLGMRTLSAILSMASSDIDGMRQYLGSLIAERTGITDQQKLATRTDEAIVWIGAAIGFGAVKRVSYAVGHGDLTTTYQRLIQSDRSLSTQMIDVVIKLDHFERVPEKELEEIRARVQKNHFAYTVMRDIVADHLYLYSHDSPTMQKLGANWEIKVSASKFLINRSKK
ncbi:MAG TPA: metallophosphoesterase [Terracidiphilus sp.]|jgi:predicted MPP superfamily phosphohydrolase|nr:metallophosphoesterase [Terracidiphilus sp.]